MIIPLIFKIAKPTTALLIFVDENMMKHHQKSQLIIDELALLRYITAVAKN